MATAQSLPQDDLAKNTYDNVNFIVEYLSGLLKKVEERLSILENQRNLIAQRIAEKERQKEEAASKKNESPTAASLIAASGLSQADIDLIEKKYGTSLYEDLVGLEKALLEREREVAKITKQERKERIKEKRKEIFKNNAKQCFKIDENELINISKKDEAAFKNFVRGKGKFKSTSSKKAIKGISPLFKGLVNSLLYHEVNINVVVDEGDRRKKKKKSLPIKEAAIILYKQTIGRLVETVKTTVNSGVKLVQTKIAASKLGRAILNTKTGLSNIGKTLKLGYDGLKLGYKAIGGFGTAVVPALLVYAATGGAILPAAAAFVTIGATSTINSILRDSHLSSIRGIRNFQLKYGEGQFYNPSGSIKLATEEVPALQATIDNLTKKISAGQKLTAAELSLLRENKLRVDAFQKPNLSQFSRISKALGTGSTFASIGFAIGTLFGAGPQAALIAGIIGGGGSYALNTLRGLGLKGIVNANSKLLNFFARIPYADVLSVMQSNLWIASQLQLIDSAYKGDIGKYLKENFLFGGNTGFTSIVNYLQVASTVFSYATLVSRFAAAFGILTKLKNVIATTPAGIAALIGSTSAIIALSLLGVPLGPVAILSAGIGTAAGIAAGVALAALVSNPIGAFFVIVGTTFFGAGFFGWLGSFGDKALNKLTGGIMSAINMWASLFQLISLISMKFNSDNLIMFALTCLSLIQIWSKEQEMATTNVSATSNNKTSAASPTIESFSFYKVNFINNIPLSAKTRSNLLSFIAENKEYFNAKYPDKQIFLTTAPNAAFESDKIVMLSISIDDVINANFGNLAQEIRSQNSSLANFPDAKVEQN